VIKIKHQQQRRNDDCSIACVRMIADGYGISENKVEQAINIIHPEFDNNYQGTSSDEICFIFHLLGIRYIAYKTPIMAADRLYIITVPSLNIAGLNHSIIVQAFSSENIVVFDPAEGRDSKKLYTNDNIKNLSYSEVVEILGA